MIFSLLFAGGRIKPAHMRTHLVKSFFILATVSLSLLGATRAIAQDASDPVTIEKDRILIPGTNISEKDQRSLNGVLAQYDKSLYKITGYVNGKAKKPQGTLASAKIDPATAARAAVHAKDPHFTGQTVQVTFVSNQSVAHRTSNSGSTTNQSKSGNTSNQSKPGNTSNQDIPNPVTADASKAQELIKRLTPILRKYTKTQTAR
jgi:hypothetical protein